MTRREAALQLGMTEATYRDYETGKRNPRRGRQEKLEDWVKGEPPRILTMALRHVAAGSRIVSVQLEAGDGVRWTLDAEGRIKKIQSRAAKTAAAHDTGTASLLEI